MARPTADDILAAYHALTQCCARLQMQWAPPLTPDEERELVLDVMEAIAGQRQNLQTLLVAADWRNSETYSRKEHLRLLDWQIARRQGETDTGAP
jgi:hypothetical protein